MVMRRVGAGAGVVWPLRAEVDGEEGFGASGEGVEMSSLVLWALRGQRRAQTCKRPAPTHLEIVSVHLGVDPSLSLLGAARLEVSICFEFGAA